MKIKEIRSEIDKIDSEIIELLSRRSSLVKDHSYQREPEGLGLLLYAFGMEGPLA